MMNQAFRPDRRSRFWRLRTMPLLLFLALEACLVSLIGIAVNVATTKPEELRELPGLLQWVGEYPWHAVAALTLVAGWFAFLRVRREETTTTSTHLSGPVDSLTLRGSVPLTRAEAAQARRELLGRVRRTWIQGVLDRSMAEVAHIDLGLIEQAGAIDHPWGTLVHQPGQPNQQLPAGTRISEIAGRFDDHLLVLGAPGAGKTTLLLEYARDLLDQADHDQSARIPVILHLSAWPDDQPSLAEWLVAELRTRYGLAKWLAAELVERDRLAVLLDGLDEVPAARGEACVAAINNFRGEHGSVPLVVCARTREYHDLADRLTLNGAVEVQPLDRSQVRRWLETAGRPLAGLRTAMHKRSQWLWGLLDTPLLLSIAARTYHGQPSTAIRAHGSVQELLEGYVDAMLARPRAPLAPGQEQVAYDRTDTVRWLAWLAERLGEETLFYPDWMQPDWLPTRRQRWLVMTGLDWI